MFIPYTVDGYGCWFGCFIIIPHKVDTPSRHALLASGMHKLHQFPVDDVQCVHLQVALKVYIYIYMLV